MPVNNGMSTSSVNPSAIGYTQRMGNVAVARIDTEGLTFARELNAYLRYLLAPHSTAKDGRWLQEHCPARAKDYWSNLLNDITAMNTIDIQVLAEFFGVNPYAFVASARELARTGEADRPAPSVGPHPEDYTIESAPIGYALAAKRISGKRT